MVAAVSQRRPRPQALPLPTTRSAGQRSREIFPSIATNFSSSVPRNWIRSTRGFPESISHRAMVGCISGRSVVRATAALPLRPGGAGFVEGSSGSPLPSRVLDPGPVARSPSSCCPPLLRENETSPAPRIAAGARKRIMDIGSVGPRPGRVSPLLGVGFLKRARIGTVCACAAAAGPGR